jgi:hypothetical protein
VVYEESVQNQDIAQDEGYPDDEALEQAPQHQGNAKNEPPELHQAQLAD